MQPFLISEPRKQLVDPYPDMDRLRTVSCAVSLRERECITRLWLSEGIPFAFRDLPISYEVIRGWLAERLYVHPKNVTVIGSARIGYSLAPYPNYGRPFSQDSDLDFSIVSKDLFSKLSEEFYKWRNEVEEGRLHPTESQRRYWYASIECLPNTIRRGFIDPNKIPYIAKRYPIAQRIGNTMWLLREKLNITQDVPKVKKASIRVYRDWAAFMAQMKINFENMLTSLDKFCHKQSKV